MISDYPESKFRLETEKRKQSLETNFYEIMNCNGRKYIQHSYHHYLGICCSETRLFG